MKYNRKIENRRVRLVNGSSVKTCGEKGTVDSYVERCKSALDIAYCSIQNSGNEYSFDKIYSAAARHIIRMAVLLLAAEQIPKASSIHKDFQIASGLIKDASVNSDADYAEFCRVLGRINSKSGLDLFKTIEPQLPAFHETAKAFLYSQTDSLIDPIYFQSMPLFWLGCAYQGMLTMNPTPSGKELERSHKKRKGSGSFFTPPSLVEYVVEGVLSPIVQSKIDSLDCKDANSAITSINVLDPSMGSGDFLVRVIEFICEKLSITSKKNLDKLRADIAANCVYGLDIDPVAVEIAGFCVWAASGYADGISEKIRSNLLCADTLAADEDAFNWHKAFEKVFKSDGFDAVVGNPPYIASKNGHKFKASNGNGQQDTYLQFLHQVIDKDLVKPNGMLSMVLPDPVLIRKNAANIRRKLSADWRIVSLLHILGAFPDAGVANLVPICKNTLPAGGAFESIRIEHAADRKSFISRPGTTAYSKAKRVRLGTVLSQRKCEFLYLLEDGEFGDVIRRIHGEELCLSKFCSPFAPLKELNIKAIYRGEETGKAAIDKEQGDMPMLLGGQSISPYRISWEGRRIDLSRIKKSRERYCSTKVILQKSSGKLIAALDQVDGTHKGYVFPQSVYAVELRNPGMHEVYLLCLLNSEVLNEYIRRTVTGYKLLQPQLEIRDIKSLPIRRINFTSDNEERNAGLQKGISIFENEASAASGFTAFPELSNYAAKCLVWNPERSDVVHDLLVYLGYMVIDLTEKNQTSPDMITRQRLESARAAIEVIVRRLYSSKPAQMELVW